MSSQERNQHALQRLVKYIAPRLYENEPDSAQSERALRALTGVLASNPPYVIDAFELTEDLRDWIVDVAISKSGKIAILLGSHVDEKSSNVFLTTWPRPRGYCELLNLGPVKDNATVRVLFPEGSDTPAVIVGGEKIVWGNWTLDLPWKEDLVVPKEACLTLFSTDDHQKIVYIFDGKVNAKVRQHVLKLNAGPPIDFISSGSVTRWLVPVNGLSAWITSEDPEGQCETLHWGSVEAIMLRGEQIIPESISVVNGGIQFVTTNHGKMFAHRVNINNPKEDLISDPVEFCVWGDGHIFGFYHYHPSTDKGQICEFDLTGQWVPVAELAYPKFRHVEQLFSEGDHFTMVNQEIGGLTLYSGVRGDLKVEATPIVRGPKTGFVRAHSGLLYQTLITGTGGFIWSALDNVPGKRPLTATFPCYGRFDQLVPIEDDRGKAIMGWGYAEGTFCVIRYPLPTR